MDISFLGESLAAQLKTSRGLIDADRESGKTGTEGFYAGGDVVTGPDLAIRAIAAGRNAAMTMDGDMGIHEAEEHEITASEEISVHERFATFDVEGVERTQAGSLCKLPADERSLTGEDQGSMDQETAKEEAARCLHCACYAVNPSDITPVLVMEEAQIVTTERTLSAKELFTSKLTVQNVLHRGELVKEIQVPKAVGKSHYDKRRVRNAIDFAIVSLASTMDVKDGVIERCRLVLGGVAPVPYQLPEVEAYLTGKRITAEVAREAGEMAMKQAFAMSGNEYKIFMCKDVIYNRVMEVGG